MNGFFTMLFSTHVQFISALHDDKKRECRKNNKTNKNLPHFNFS